MSTLAEKVKLNQSALLTPAVHLDFYSDESRSTRLSEGFIFSYKEGGFGSSRVSGVEVLLKLKDAFAREDASRVLSLIATYGVGKSHLALTLANFFGRAESHRAVQGILRTLKALNPAIAAELEGFKKLAGKPMLVLPITLSDTADLKQRIRSTLRQVLDDGKIDYAVAGGHRSALEWVEKLNATEQARAETWLHDRYKGAVELSMLTVRLTEFDTQALQIARDLSEEFYSAPLDFGHDSDLAEVLKDVADNLCGAQEGKPFSGILLILDELSAYLEHWILDRKQAGGMALQEITDAIAQRPRRIAMACLGQFPYSEYEKRSSGIDGATIGKLTGRLEPSFRLVSSLEHVIARIIEQGQALKTELRSNKILRATSDSVYRLQPQYHARFTADEFWEIVGAGCYPLHPLTVCILCYLADSSGFVQGRALIHFLNTVLKEHLSRSSEVLYSISIFDFFEDRLEAQEGRYAALFRDYQWAFLQIGGATASPQEVALLKAVFLGELCQLPRPENHEFLLALLTGLDETVVEDVCTKLVERGALRYDQTLDPPAYALWHGAGSKMDETIRENARAVLSKGWANPVGIAEKLSDKIEARCRDTFARLEARRFKTMRRVSADSWCFRLVFDGREAATKAGLLALRRKLPTPEDAQGLLVVILTEEAPNSEAFIAQCLKVLGDEEPRIKEVAERLVLGLPCKPMRGLLSAAANCAGLGMVTDGEKRRYGADAYEACEQRYEEDFLNIIASGLDTMHFVVSPLSLPT